MDKRLQNPEGYNTKTASEGTAWCEGKREAETVGFREERRMLVNMIGVRANGSLMLW